MKKNFILFFTILLSNSLAIAETGDLNSALKSSGYEPNYFSILVSLIFVVLLIYVTGILYTKLNKISVKTVKNELKENNDIKPIVISSTPIGTDKVLQVIEIAGERLLLGVSQHSINLIKTLGRTNTITQEQIKDTKETNKTINLEETKKEEHSINPEEFGLYKKYLR